MLNRKNFSKRVAEARALARFAKITRDTGTGFEVFVPGHEAKMYRVILKWTKTGKDYTMVSECGLSCGPAGYKNCKGNSMNVCYHVMAAVIAVAKAHGTEVSFTVDEKSAAKLVNIKTHANRLHSKQSLESIWMVS